MNLTTARLPRAWLAIFLLIPLMTLAAFWIIRRSACPPLTSRETGAPTPSAPQTQIQSPPGSSPTSADGSSMKLIIPVKGVRPEDLRDTFNAARAEGRKHDAIDILAPKETPVLAAADGEIVRLFQSKRGGNTIYQLSADKTLVFYYAHLDHYADGLAEGHQARQGEVIGYVGDTGNAGEGNYHLHFSIWRVTDPKQFWNGVNINPYPILRGAH